jgi:diaminopimelate decarboxylase/aspartate kinase
MNHSLPELHATPAARWVVAKFGGTSVARPERWQRIADIAADHVSGGRRVLVVCSAVAGVTNLLESIVATIDAGDSPAHLIGELGRIHGELALALGVDAAVVAAQLADAVDAIATCPRPVPPRSRALILAQGELLSTRLGAAWLAREGHSVAWQDARTLLRAAAAGDRSERYLSAECDAAGDPAALARLTSTGASVVVTQGFIASDDAGDTVLLGRGGSDTSA